MSHLLLQTAHRPENFFYISIVKCYEDMITVYCDSLQGFYDCEPGMTVGELSRKIDTG